MEFSVLYTKRDYEQMRIAIDFTYIKDRPYCGTFQMGFSILRYLESSGISCIALVSGPKDYQYVCKQGHNVELIELPNNRIMRNIKRIGYFFRNHARFNEIIFTGSFNPIFWFKGTLLIHILHN